MKHCYPSQERQLSTIWQVDQEKGWDDVQYVCGGGRCEESKAMGQVWSIVCGKRTLKDGGDLLVVVLEKAKKKRVEVCWWLTHLIRAMKNQAEECPQKHLDLQAGCVNLLRTIAIRFWNHRITSITKMIYSKMNVEGGQLCHWKPPLL